MGKCIENIDILYDSIAVFRNTSQYTISNFFANKEIDILSVRDNSLLIYEYAKCILIIKKDINCDHLFYVATDCQSLCDALQKTIKNYNKTIVIDIVGFDSQTKNIRESLSTIGFQLYRTFYRMSRAINSCVNNDNTDNNIVFATMDDAQELFCLLHSNFDELCERIPSLSELQLLIKSRGVLIYKYHNEIACFVIFELKNMSFHWRYWLTLPKYRDMHIGSKVVGKMMSIAQTAKRQILWVNSDNQNAINRHLHYGFKAEPLYDYVLIKN